MGWQVGGQVGRQAACRSWQSSASACMSWGPLLPQTCSTREKEQNPTGWALSNHSLPAHPSFHITVLHPTVQPTFPQTTHPVLQEVTKGLLFTNGETDQVAVPS